MQNQFQMLQQAADRINRFHTDRTGYDDPKSIVASLWLLCESSARVECRLLGRIECSVCARFLEGGHQLSCGHWLHAECLSEQAAALSPSLESAALANLRCAVCQSRVSEATLALVVGKEWVDRARQDASRKVILQLEREERERRQRQADSRKFKCPKCGLQFKIDEMLTLNCQNAHRFCRGCLQRHIAEQVRIGKFHEIGCITCAEEIDEAVLQAIMKPEQFQRVLGMRRRYVNQQAEIVYPKYWVNNGQDFTLFPVVAGSEEFNKVQNQFKIFPIKVLRRVENLIQWKKYFREKEELQATTGGPIQQRFLFHGTRANDPRNVYQAKDQAFNLNFSNPGNAYGLGTYFAVNAQYSHSGYVYVQNNLKTMLYCRVMVGTSQTTKIGPGMKDTEFRDPVRKIRYQSVFNGTMYVIYKIRRAYPEYIIDY